MSGLRHLLILVASAAAVLGGGSAMAERAEPPLRYTIRSGDTLISLARNYLIEKDNYRTVQDLNKVRDPYRLPIGSTLLIPAELLRMEPIAGEITSFRGDVAVSGQPASLGMKIQQGMRVETGANAFVTVQLPDGSSISLPSQSRVSVVKLRRVLLTGGIQRTFRLTEGRARSSVTPIKDPGSNFQVTTPLSVAAVRGTDFRVAFDEAAGKALTEVVGGTVGVGSDAEPTDKAIPKGYGVVSTPAGTGEPVELLPPPGLGEVARAGGDGVVVTIKPVEGAVKYHTQLATDVNFFNVIADATTDDPKATFSALGNVSFYVRLTAIAASGLEGMPGTYALGRSVVPGTGGTVAQ